MGFNELNYQENRLANLKSNYSRCKSKLDTQKKRKNKIEDLLKKMKNVVNDRSDDVNDHISKIINNLDNALRGTTSASLLLGAVSSDKDKGLSDDNMHNAYYQLRSEFSDVDNKIIELERELRKTDEDIHSCNNSIRYEKRNIASTYKTKFDQADYKFKTAKKAYEKDPSSAQLKYAYNVAKTNRNNAKYNYDKYKHWL